MRAWFALLVCLLPLAAASPDAAVPEASASAALTTYTHEWSPAADVVGDGGLPSQVAGCRVVEGRYWTVAPPALGDPDACVRSVHSGPILATTITCPTTTHCSVFAETEGGAYGAFQIHCFPLGAGVQPAAGPLVSAQCQLLNAGADPATWTAWTSWLSVGPGGGPFGGTTLHAFGR